MKKINLRRTITGIVVTSAMAFTAIAPTAISSTVNFGPTAITAEAANINMTQDEYQRGLHIYNYLKSHTNWNDGAICGLLAHMYKESRFISTATNSSSGAYGVAQWLGSRKAELMRRSNYSNVDVQLNFLIDEVYNRDSCASDDFKISREAILNATNNAQGAYNTAFRFRLNFGWGVSNINGGTSAQRADCTERAKEARDFFYNKFADGIIIDDSFTYTTVNYTTRLEKNTPIYANPGDTTPVSSISVATLYTIVQEATNSTSKYGKLKSGAGWVKLSGSNNNNTGIIIVEPYIVRLPAGTKIYKEPGSSTVVQTLSTGGSFTIIKEQTVSGVKYGYLKSGIGWVKL
ncbi:phage tail tip lysozyme [Ruminococcus flavefaciens]|uniref:phage tail tip lysozyme n=1 Tax=Ruminococcus flavefaciens TaxID=1265 RepID=UPI0003022FD9|nr:phage tail tip lysozyme [Ruminococcus flavefaciens]